MYQEFTQEMKNLMETFQQNIHTVLPGKIVKFDADKCEAQVSPTAKFWKPDATKIDYPDIFEVPVFFIQGIGQKVTITHAIKPDDECMLFFFEQALDQWRTKAQSDTDLRFDITNAVAVVGFFAKPNPLVKRACDNESIIIQRENSFVEWFEEKIEVETDGDIYITAADNITVGAGANIEVSAGNVVNIDCKTLNITASAAITMKSPIITIDGDINHTGSMDTSGQHTDSVGGHC